MAAHSFNSAQRPAGENNWQDWAKLIVAAWLFASPWALHFVGRADAAGAVPGRAAVALADASWNAWLCGIVIFLTAMSAIERLRLSEEWIILLVGVWLFVSPWVLGFASLAAASWDDWAVGALTALMSLSLISRAASRGPAG